MTRADSDPPAVSLSAAGELDERPEWADTGRVYPARPDSLGVDLFAYGGAAALVSLDAWRMRSIWP